MKSKDRSENSAEERLFWLHVTTRLFSGMPYSFFWYPGSYDTTITPKKYILSRRGFSNSVDNVRVACPDGPWRKGRFQNSLDSRGLGFPQSRIPEV